MRTGTSVTAEYDVPTDAWYFAENGAATHAVRRARWRSALQPCGWLAMYLGSVLDADATLLFRNLDGTGIVHREVWPDAARCAPTSRARTSPGTAA